MIDLVIVGDEAYLPDELCSECQERPSIARGLCARCYQQRPEKVAYRAGWNRRARIARLGARIEGLQAELAALRSEDADMSSLLALPVRPSPHLFFDPSSTRVKADLCSGRAHPVVGYERAELASPPSSSHFVGNHVDDTEERRR